MDKGSHLETVKDKVEDLLKDYGVLRDSDKLLWLAYLCRYHNMQNLIGQKAYLAFKKMLLDENTPTMGTVIRVRQKIQEDGLYQGEKRMERLALADQVSDWAVENKYD